MWNIVTFISVVILNIDMRQNDRDKMLWIGLNKRYVSLASWQKLFSIVYYISQLIKLYTKPTDVD